MQVPADIKIQQTFMDPIRQFHWIMHFCKPKKQQGQTKHGTGEYRDGERNNYLGRLVGENQNISKMNNEGDFEPR